MLNPKTPQPWNNAPNWEQECEHMSLWGQFTFRPRHHSPHEQLLLWSVCHRWMHRYNPAVKSKTIVSGSRTGYQQGGFAFCALNAEGRAVWDHPTQTRCGMWGRSGRDICHSIDCQGWFGWSGWLGGCPLPPLLLHVCPSWSCILGWRGWSSPNRGELVFDQGYTRSCISLLEPPNTLDVYVGAIQSLKLKTTEKHSHLILDKVLTIYLYL